jgi:hypothetical protein
MVRRVRKTVIEDDEPTTIRETTRVERREIDEDDDW